LAIGGDQTNVTLPRPGQNALYTFAGTAKQTVTVTISNSAIDDGDPNTSGGVSIRVLDVNGYSQIASSSFGTASKGVTFSAILPETGSYAIEISPSALNSGSFNLAAR